MENSPTNRKKGMANPQKKKLEQLAKVGG